MGARELPVLNFAPFRKYPTKEAEQDFPDSRQVCHGCVSGICCTNEDSIALSAFDIFRLAAFFDMSPAQFMLEFTQERFAYEDSEMLRRGWNEDRDSSIVTWLRRRANRSASPCIFLKYIRDADGTPRRVCSVHDARPLSCREYYFHHCKTRGAGELASLLAEGFEKVRDGEIAEAMVDAQLARFGKIDFEATTLSENMEYSFWVEMKRVINMDQANTEGSNSYDMADFQDPINEKLNRVLSAKYLRFEEDYGAKPRDEQLMPYTSGLSFAGSPEYRRIMAVRRTPPSSGLFALRDYSFYVGRRTMVPGVKHAEIFQTIPDADVNAFLDRLPHVRLFSDHDLQEVRDITLRDLYASVLKGYNYLIGFASHVAALDPLLEFDPPGTIEAELLKAITEFETSLNPYVAHNPYLQPVKHHMARVTIDRLEGELADSPDNVFDHLSLLCTLQIAGTTLPPELQNRAEALRRDADAKLQKDRLDLYMCIDNPVEARRAAGKRIGSGGAWRAWSEWYGKVLDVRYAVTAGFRRIDLTAFYRQSVDDLEKLPFRRSYAICLCDIVKYLAYSMTSYNRIARQDMPYKDAADRLASYGTHLFNWMENKGYLNHDYEMVGEFSAAVYKGLGLSYNQDRNFGVILRRLLGSQLPDGSWETNPLAENRPESQAEFWDTMYRPTVASINGLRPILNDLLNPENAALGLV